MRTLIIGDVHGNIDRLRALLIQENIIYKNDYKRRPMDDTLVIQVGDLGHIGRDTKQNDLECYKLADEAIDFVCWGNHDFACFHSRHIFSGFAPPLPETEQILGKLERTGRLVMATHAEGFLITHAGLCAELYEELKDLKDKPELIARSIQDHYEDDVFGAWGDLWHYIGEERGGYDAYGGILWNDWRMARANLCNSICGHTSEGTIRYDTHGNWCIDVGTEDNGMLAGVYIEDGKVVNIVHVGTKPKVIREDTKLVDVK